MHAEEGMLGANPNKVRKKKEKKKKHRPKVVEVEKRERKPKTEVPMTPLTPKQKTPGNKKGKVIGKRTFARKKLFANYLHDEDEWEEVGDQLQPSADEPTNSSRRMQRDGELAVEEDLEPWESELIAENMPVGSTNNSTDLNIRINELLQALSKLPQKSFSPPLLKIELLQLNADCPVDTLKCIVDNIKIPCLLHFLNQARRYMTKNRFKVGHKLREGLDLSAYGVLEEFICALKKFLPSLLMKYDLSQAAGQMFNNCQGGRSKRNISKSKEPRTTARKTSILNADSNFQIVPNTYFHGLRSRLQGIEFSRTTPMTCNFLINGQISQNLVNTNLTPSQGHINTMQLSIQDVVNGLRFLDINKDLGSHALAEPQNAIVPSFEGGMIIPYDKFPEQVKQKPHRVEVLLDSETNRLWKLLQENQGENAEDMDFCKLKWWENERRVFLGRAKSFIARMNLILGDRRFSPWKGSIVDSVVGVFLTQNVSDHLSSSAFMSLAAKFPPQRSGYGGGYSVTKLDEHEKTSTDAISSIHDVPSLSNCDGKNPMEIQLNRYPINVCSTIINSCENAPTIDMDECILKNVVNFSKAFGENAQYECRDLPHNLFESIACSNSNNHSVDTMDVNVEATTISSNKTKTFFKLEKHTSREKKADAAEERKIYWEGMRRGMHHDSDKKERIYESLDSINWEAVRNADVKQISEAIRERGMNNLLAERIKDFLNRLVRDHGSIDLEWLRNLRPDDAKKFLLSIRGLGLKSVECVRLLALQNAAFPVDTNVARISVRLGWVPLKPLPEFLQLHLLEQYPIMDSVQKYIWPRLCRLDHKELYELHYHMITFGKVFCTKNRPNCNVCPMRGECKHFNSAKLALPSPEDKHFKSSLFPNTSLSGSFSFSPIPQIQFDKSHVSGGLNHNFDPIIEYPPTPIIEEPPPSPPHESLQIIEEPLSLPSHETIQILERDIEDAFYKDDEIPAIKLNLEQFGQNLQNLMGENDTKIHDEIVSKALVELSAEVSSIPIQKLKNISGLRTEHHVYELPDSHTLLKEMDQREPDDPSPYLLAIWTPGETAQSTEPPESCCKAPEICRLCETETCFTCNNRRELEAQTVRGTLLIPCRTALKGRFPLNGTYFQINEVFADHDSSRIPIHIPRSWIWNLPRRTVYFGTSVAAIFRGFTATEPIKHCFSRGFVCVRGFDRLTREPKPLYARLHLPKSKTPSNKKPRKSLEE